MVKDKVPHAGRHITYYAHQTNILYFRSILQKVNNVTDKLQLHYLLDHLIVLCFSARVRIEKICQYISTHFGQIQI